MTKPQGPLDGGPREIATKFFRWWVNELAGLVPPPVRAMIAARRPHIFLSRTDTGIALYQVERRRLSPISVFDLPVADDAIFKDLVERAMRKCGDARLGILVEPRDLLLRNVSLPAAAVGRLETMLKYEVERISPLPVDDIVFDSRILDQRREEGSISVQVAMWRRQDLAWWVSQPLPPRSKIYGVYLQSASEQGAEPTEVLRLAEVSKQRPSLARRVQFALAGVAALALLATELVVINRLIEGTDLLNHALVAARPAQQRAAAIKKEYQEEMERLRAGNALALRTPGSKALDDLAGILRDDTWIVRFHLSYPTVTLQGFSSNSARVLEDLRAAKGFAGARYQTPLTTAPDRTERFEIVTDLTNGSGT